ncbi:hypothetical protein [Lactococcus termiticola]|uniref:Uncharacterized protein n=1 Tax=Lactococcus termiticola TaxID=2169526 RepID=A0A2R5HIQ8_9LACT|nr:hypothetical protein [Lactococcus termiticola]GBG97515.1 hypothetical protein NtB2_01661 [Lactococcus termiticola]
MFAASYKIQKRQRQLTQLGILGTIIAFILLSLMFHWQMLYSGMTITLWAEILLWLAPTAFTFALAGTYYFFMNFRLRHKRQSFGVTVYWTVMSLLPAATLVSIAEYLALSPLPVLLVHSLALLLSIGLFGLLWLSSRNMLKHSRIILFSVGFYALASALQLLLVAM